MSSGQKRKIFLQYQRFTTWYNWSQMITYLWPEKEKQIPKIWVKNGIKIQLEPESEFGSDSIILNQSFWNLCWSFRKASREQTCLKLSKASLELLKVQKLGINFQKLFLTWKAYLTSNHHISLVFIETRWYKSHWKDLRVTYKSYVDTKFIWDIFLCLPIISNGSCISNIRLMIRYSMLLLFWSSNWVLKTLFFIFFPTHACKHVHNHIPKLRACLFCRKTP